MCASNSAALELAEPVAREARGIVDQQPHRRQPLGRGEDPLGAIGFGKVGDDLDRALRHRVAVVMDMRDDRPAVGEQRRGNRRADALAGPGDDRGAFDVVIARSHARSPCDAGWIAACDAIQVARTPHAREPPPDRASPASRSTSSPRCDRRRARLPPVDRWNPEPLRRSARCASPATAPGIIEGTPDQPPGDGAAVLDRAAPRARRQPRPRHPGRKARHRGRGDRLPRDRMEAKARASSAASRFALDSGDALIVGRDHPLTVVDDEHGP